MKRFYTFSALTGLFLLQACGTTGEGTPVQLASNADPDNIVCKNVIRTGTRFGTRVCLSNRDWRAKREAAREATEHIQRKGGQNR